MTDDQQDSDGHLQRIAEAPNLSNKSRRVARCLSNASCKGDRHSFTDSEECEVAVFARGADGPGISLQFTKCFSQYENDVTILDIGQLLVDKMCCLYYLLQVRRGLQMDVIKSFLLTGKMVDYEVDYKLSALQELSGQTATDDAHAALTVHVLQKSPSVTPHLMGPLLETLHQYGGKVQSFHHEVIGASMTALQSLSLKVHFRALPKVVWDGEQMREMYEELQHLCWSNDAEVVLMRDDLKYKPKNKTLVVMGMCETVIQEELIDAMVRYTGKDPASFANPELSPPKVLQNKLTALKGQPASLENEVLSTVVFTEGAHLVCKVLKTLGYKLALMTQGFEVCAQHVGKQLGFDYVLSNHLEVIDGLLTGGVTGEVVGLDTSHMMDQLRKVDWLQLLREKERIPRSDVIVIGDYKHAHFLYDSCGLRINFNSHHHGDLTRVLYMMGFKKYDVQQFEDRFAPHLPAPGGPVYVSSDRSARAPELSNCSSGTRSPPPSLSLPDKTSKDDPTKKDPTKKDPTKKDPTKDDLSKKDLSKEKGRRTLKAVVYIYGEGNREGLLRAMQAIERYEGVTLQHLQQANIQQSVFLGMTITWPAVNQTESSDAGDLSTWRQLNSHECLDSASDANLDVVKDLVFTFTMLSLKIQFTLYANWSSGTRATQALCSQPTAVNTEQYLIVLVQHPQISCTLLLATYRLLAEHRINLEAIDRLSEGTALRVLQLRVQVSEAIHADDLKASLLRLSAEYGADVALQQNNIMRYCRQLVVFDMDSTLIQQEVIDELARCAGVEEEVSGITRQAMAGAIDFYESLTQRVKLLEGTSKEALDAVENCIELTPGALRLCRALRKLGYRLAVVSGGFTRFARFVKRQLGLHHAFANTLEFSDEGKLTGRVVGPVVTPQRKISLMRMLADIANCSVEQVIAVGDGANDIPMLLQAGMGVAFCAKPRVQEQADFRLNTRDLSNLLYLLGIPEQVVQRLETYYVDDDSDMEVTQERASAKRR